MAFTKASFQEIVERIHTIPSLPEVVTQVCRLVNDPDYFVQSKLLITALSVIFLTIHKNFVLFGRIAVSTLLRTACGGYLTLLGYEVALLTLIA